MTDLTELAAQCERQAVEQAEMAVSDVTWSEADDYARLAVNLFLCAASLRARASQEKEK